MDVVDCGRCVLGGGQWAGVGNWWNQLGASGLTLSYVVSVFAAMLSAAIPLFRSYGMPLDWVPHPLRIGRLALNTMPLAVADAVEWGTRRIDIAILGMFASPTSVGVYYVAQQVASLPQKLKTSFEPILGPVITRNLKEGNLEAMPAGVSGRFWITAAQAGIALALGIPGDGVLGWSGRNLPADAGAGLSAGRRGCAAPAVVSEAALIYIAPLRNLWLSLATIGLQAIFTLAGMLISGGFYFDEMDQAASAAGALMVTLSIASLVKSRLLQRHLGYRVETLRWSLFAAAVAAGAGLGGGTLFAGMGTNCSGHSGDSGALLPGHLAVRLWSGRPPAVPETRRRGRRIIARRVMD
jgi:hypothetical protein